MKAIKYQGRIWTQTYTSVTIQGEADDLDNTIKQLQAELEQYKAAAAVTKEWETSKLSKIQRQAEEIERLKGILDSIYYSDPAEPLDNVVKRAIEKYHEKGETE